MSALKQFVLSRHGLRFLAFAAVFLAGAGLLDAYLVSQMSRRHLQDQRLETALRLSSIRARLEERLYANLLLLHGMGAAISANPGMSAERFRVMAREILRRPNQLQNIAAAPNFVIRYVYPRRGNEAILGKDYRDLPGQWEMALQARETGKMAVAGPLDLIQGGRGLVARVPVFVQDDGEERFWGLVSAVMELEGLMREAEEEAAGLELAIRGKDGRGDAGKVFHGDPALFGPDARAMTARISLPTGWWWLAAVPAGGWQATHPDARLVHVVFLAVAAAVLAAVYAGLRRNRQLRETRESLSRAQAIAGLGSWDWDVESGEVRWSDETYRIFGLEHGTPVSRELFEGLVHPEDLPEVQAAMGRALEDPSVEYRVEHRIVRPDGEERCVQTLGHMMRDAAGRPVYLAGTVQDVTARKRSEVELRQARQHIYDILESTTDAFFEVDAEFNLTYINHLAEKSLGLSRREHLGKNLWALFPQAVGTMFHKEYTRALEEQQVAKFEGYYQPFDNWFEVYAYPTPNSLSVYFHDITERRRLQEERDNIFQLSLDMICVAGFDGYFRKLNPSWQRVLGWTPEELKSRPWVDFVHPDDVEETLAAGSNLSGGRKIISFENRYRCKDGSYRWLSWNSYPDTGKQVIYAVARDVTRRKQDERSMAESERRFRMLVEKSPVGIALNDSEGNMLYLNPRFQEIFGYTLEDAPTLEALWMLAYPDDQEREKARQEWNDMVRAARRGDVERPSRENSVRCKGGEVKEVEFRYVDIDGQGMTMATDITKRKHLEAELTRLATIDPLTGAANRREFMNRGSLELDRFMRYSRPFSLIMLDIDHFKNVNDTEGHSAGDEALRVLTRVCRERLRSNDVFARLGGEEFAALLPETGLDEAAAVAERIREDVMEADVVLEDRCFRITVSLGVAEVSEADDSLEDALVRADRAMYEAKRLGRNRVRLAGATG